MPGTMPPQSARWTIAHNYGRWTTRSAMNSNGPVKSTSEVNRAIDTIVDFPYVLDTSLGTIGKANFEDWHHRQVCKLLEYFKHKQLTYGWAAKMIAIYLKTTCYLAHFGRPGLDQVIHPPIDNILVKALRGRYKNTAIADGLKDFRSITAIGTRQQYQDIIKACEATSKDLKCTLFEVEQLFTTGSASQA